MNAAVSLKGTPAKLYGEPLAVGEPIPEFLLVNTALRDRHKADFLGRPLLMAIVPSIDTSVCATSARRFDAAAVEHPAAAMVLVSTDLPFAQKRFVEEARISRLIMLSLMRTESFAKDYGLLIEDGPLAGLTARAVLVVDADGILRYIEIVPEITEEPNYEAAIAALSQIETEIPQ